MNIDNLQDIFRYVIDLMNQLGLFLIGLALLGFLWGVFNYIFHGKNPDKRREGNAFMIYGLLSLFVITSFWGLVIILQETFGIGSLRGQDNPFGADRSGGFDIVDPATNESFENVDQLFDNNNELFPI